MNDLSTIILAAVILVLGIFYLFIAFSTYTINRQLEYSYLSSVIIALLMPIVGVTEMLTLGLAHINNFMFNRVCEVGGVDPDEYEAKVVELASSYQD